MLVALGRLDAARLEFELAQDIQQKLAAQFRAVQRYQVELGHTDFNLANLIRVHQGRPAESLPWFDKAIETLAAVHEKEPRDVQVKQSLRNSYYGRALALDGLHRHSESVKDWQKVIELSTKAEAPGVRAARGFVR